jgi:hypothetical protein
MELNTGGFEVCSYLKLHGSYMVYLPWKLPLKDVVFENSKMLTNFRSVMKTLCFITYVHQSPMPVLLMGMPVL